MAGRHVSAASLRSSSAERREPVTHVITQACCGDAACVFACPVNAIQPNPDDELFESAEMLYIDPKTCVDCGACVAACAR